MVTVQQRMLVPLDLMAVALDPVMKVLVTVILLEEAVQLI